MKTSEARTKWCPFVKIDTTTVDGAGELRKLPGIHKIRFDAGNHCIASDCAMWRTQTSGGSGISNAPVKVSGYCGLTK